jgi:hypothetical protein
MKISRFVVDARVGAIFEELAVKLEVDLNPWSVYILINRDNDSELQTAGVSHMLHTLGTSFASGDGTSNAGNAYFYLFNIITCTYYCTKCTVIAAAPSIMLAPLIKYRQNYNKPTELHLPAIKSSSDGHPNISITHASGAPLLRHKVSFSEQSQPDRPDHNYGDTPFARTFIHPSHTDEDELLRTMTRRGRHGQRYSFLHRRIVALMDANWTDDVPQGGATTPSVLIGDGITCCVYL